MHIVDSPQRAQNVSFDDVCKGEPGILRVRTADYRYEAGLVTPRSVRRPHEPCPQRRRRNSGRATCLRKGIEGSIPRVFAPVEFVFRKQG